MRTARRRRRVGIRDCKAHLSEIVRRVRSGEVVEITDRGEPVARIVPVRPAAVAGDPYEASIRALLEAGWIGERPPRRRHGLPPPIDLPPGVSAQQMLRADRDAR